MSCHLPYRLTKLHRSVSMALLYSVSYAALISNAQAATMGKTIITSAQHEPLVASIMVTNIQTPDFTASLADSSIYQQMGLSPTDSMTVRFQPTSATSGQVFITTTKPVSKPFADVVLAINDGAQRSVIPKTLLMPLDGSLPINPSKNSVTAAKKPNLPTVSATNAQPLIVTKGTPPPLLLTSTEVNKPTVQGNNTVYATDQSDTNRLNNDGNSNNNFTVPITNNTNTSPTVALNSPNAATPINNTPFELDILNIQIIRQIQPNRANKENKAKNSDIIVSTPMSPMSPMSDHSLSTANTVANDTIPYNNNSSNSISTLGSNTDISSISPDDASGSEFNYTVQRNDNLWVIAQQIAEKNNLDVQIVMNEIQTQNPNAFINKNANQLKADAQLSLPKYDVVPSQKKLQTAIGEQRKHSRNANTSVIKKDTISKAASKTQTEKAQAAKRNETLAIKKTQKLPTAQFSVIAPGHSGSADGTKTKAGVAAGNGLSTDVLDILKSSRQSTADQAQRLSKTNSTLDSYTKKLQLQNQKLAELQARLEKLRNQ
ncbi:MULTISPECIES: FimV family protein [unclassified Psychrobacter]|uniref:type IV pilus assembly protein FimV n=1 Tax=unclassified Psychrobacter TaxID=196806 RepID=UPI0025FDF845|nr:MULTISPECIES: peptigoglycan-binding protein LysM [unclassified Psychrobacter]